MTVRIGANPIAWSNDGLPELGGDTPLGTCLAEAREAGFTGIKLGNKFPRKPAALQAVLGRHGLSLASGWYGAALRPLAEAAYAGWLIVEAEQDPARAHPLTYGRAGYAHLRSAAGEAGFVVGQ